MTRVVYTGDAIEYKVQLRKDGIPFQIPSDATVKAAFFVGQDLVSDVFTVVEATTGSDWDNSLIVVKATELQTDVLPTGLLKLEVQIEYVGVDPQDTFVARVPVEYGHIS